MGSQERAKWLKCLGIGLTTGIIGGPGFAEEGRTTLECPSSEYWNGTVSRCVRIGETPTRESVNTPRNTKNALIGPRCVMPQETRGVELNVKNANDATERGRMLANAGSRREAILLFQKAIELDAGNADAYWLRGIAFVGLGEYGCAIEDFEKVASLRPGYEGVALAKCMTYRSMGDDEKALEEYHRAVTAAPLPCAEVRRPADLLAAAAPALCQYVIACAGQFASV